MEYFKQLIENWIFSPLQLVLDPPSQDDPKAELKIFLEEILRNIQEVQTDVMAALDLKEKLELVLDPSSQDDSIDELKEKLDEKFLEVQTKMTKAAFRLKNLKYRKDSVLLPKE